LSNRMKEEPQTYGTGVFLSQEEFDSLSEKDTFRILMATDIHLGHKLSDPVRFNDSFTAFEELLQHAQKYDVDFLLWGGDLFDKNNPTVPIFTQTISLMFQYIVGNKPVQFRLLSDASRNFGHTCPEISDAHWLWPSINISYPVLSIHGNHDNPTGPDNLSAIDVLAGQGLLSHFGKNNDLDQIMVEPVLLQKGQTKIALYGIGSQKDERLHYMFKKGHVNFKVPESDDFFNILVLHQNRVAHSAHDYIPEDAIPDFIDLVLWGHEHDDLFGPNFSSAANCWISQPGSTIPTSLTVGESQMKSVGLLTVTRRKFRLDKVPLETGRIMIVRDVRLSDYISENEKEFLKGKSEEEQMPILKRVLEAQVHGMLEQAEHDRKERPKAPELPLLRLRVTQEKGYPTVNAAMFGDKFRDVAANRDILLCRKDKSLGIKTTSKQIDEDVKRLMGRNQANLVELIEHHLVTKDPLKCLGEVPLTTFTERLVDMNMESDAKSSNYKGLGTLIQKQEEIVYNEVLERFAGSDRVPDENEVLRCLENIRHAHMKDYKEDDSIKELLENEAKKKASRMQSKMDVSDESEADSDEPVPKKASPAKRGRGRGRGRGRTKR